MSRKGHGLPSGEDSLASLLREWRRRAALTQQQLAARAGLGIRTIRRLETRDLPYPRGESVLQLAGALDLTEPEQARLLAAARRRSLRQVRPAAGPHDLPADVTTFVGRTGYLRRLDDLLTAAESEGTTTAVAITGAAGTGKTALTVHWAHQVADRFPDGHLFVDLCGHSHLRAPIEPAAAIRGLLNALRVPVSRIPTNAETQIGLYRSLLAARRMLVVLDDAHDVDQVRPLLPGAVGCLTLITSRAPLTGLIAAEGVRPLVLDALSSG